MRIWLALLVAPSLALASQGILYALVTPSCSLQTRVFLHAVSAASLLLTAVLTQMAHSEWKARARMSAEGPDSDEPDPDTTRRFLAAAATAVAALSCLGILTMWMAVWVLSPCWQ